MNEQDAQEEFNINYFHVERVLNDGGYDGVTTEHEFSEFMSDLIPELSNNAHYQLLGAKRMLEKYSRDAIVGLIAFSNRLAEVLSK